MAADGIAFAVLKMLAGAAAYRAAGAWVNERPASRSDFELGWPHFCNRPELWLGSPEWCPIPTNLASDGRHNAGRPIVRYRDFPELRAVW